MGEGQLHEIGYGAYAVYFYDLFPGEQQHDFTVMRQGIRHTCIVKMRVKLWRALAESGYDFINSDADAFWLRDPRPWLMPHTEFDILASQGISKPRSHLDRYGFVLCVGFFLCRANTRTQNYLRQVEIRVQQERSDQKSINNELLYDPEARWKMRQPTVRWMSDETTVLSEKAVWHEASGLISIMIVQMRRHALLLFRSIGWLLRHSRRWHNHLLGVRWYVYTNPKIISGKFSGGLTVGVIPMHLVMRGHILSLEPRFILHSDINKAPGWQGD